MGHCTHTKNIKRTQKE